MPTFDIIAVITMWNMYNIADLNLREIKNAYPREYYNYKYFHMGLLSFCIGSSLYTLFKHH